MGPIYLISWMNGRLEVLNGLYTIYVDTGKLVVVMVVAVVMVVTGVRVKRVVAVV